MRALLPVRSVLPVRLLLSALACGGARLTDFHFLRHWSGAATALAVTGEAGSDQWKSVAIRMGTFAHAAAILSASLPGCEAQLWVEWRNSDLEHNVTRCPCTHPVLRMTVVLVPRKSARCEVCRRCAVRPAVCWNLHLSTAAGVACTCDRFKMAQKVRQPQTAWLSHGGERLTLLFEQSRLL